MGKISVVINTLNEEENLPQALSSIKDFADEIVVVDMKSEDKTVEIAKKAGAKVYRHKRENYVEPARNYAIEKARGDWILILDADEELPNGLKKELKKIVKKPEANYYRLPRKNFIFGKWVKHSRWWPDYNIRFFQKGFVSWNELIHSVPTTQGKGLDLPAKENLAIIHHNYTSVEQYLERMNRYTTIQGYSLAEDGYEFSWKDLISKPMGEFLGRYFTGEGYKDGVHGLALAGLQAFSEFVKYLKIWQAMKFKESEISVKEMAKQMRNQELELNHWKADALLKSGGGTLQKIKRKFRLP